MSSMAPMSDQLATFQHFSILGTRFKGGYIFEEPPFMSIIWMLVRPFMSEKIKSRFFLNGRNYGILDSAIKDKSILPEFLGGNLPENDHIMSSWMREQCALCFPTSVSS
jgi:hypothetical protein